MGINVGGGLMLCCGLKRSMVNDIKERKGSLERIRKGLMKMAFIWVVVNEG